MPDWEPNAVQKRAMQLILADPQASLDLQRHVARIDGGKTIPEANLPDYSFERKINAAVEPFKKKVEDLEAQLLKKTAVDIHEYQRDQLRKKGWKDSQIDELEKRMEEDKDDYLFTNYLAAAKYYQAMDQPALPNSGSRRTISGRFKEQGDWREEFHSRNGILKEGKMRDLALKGDKSRRQRRALAAEEAEKARAEFRANYSGAR